MVKGSQLFILSKIMDSASKSRIHCKIEGIVIEERGEGRERERGGERCKRQHTYTLVRRVNREMSSEKSE